MKIEFQQIELSINMFELITFEIQQNFKLEIQMFRPQRKWNT